MSSLNSHLTSLPKTLAIDFGTTRVGVAVSYGTLAEPLKIVPHDEHLFTELKNLVETEHIEQVIVGLSENEMAEKTKEFVAHLKTHISVPIELVDETLSSHTVHQRSLESGMRQSRRAQPIDHFAAAEFLQEWLDLR